MKRIIALLTVFAMLFAFASCNDSDKETNIAVTDNNGETVTDAAGEVVTEVSVLSDEKETTEASAALTTMAPVSIPSTDPSQWTDEEIVEFYKQAAIRSKKVVKSQQTMSLDKMVVNNGDGFLGTMIELATPVLKAALKSNSTEFEGITGGYENLVVTDAKNVKAYKSGEYIVVEMTMKEQTDGIHGDTFSGTVGHAISVVGDISSVEEALPQFAINFNEAVIKLHYTNPKLRVKINKNGVIEKGTWTYDVDVNVENLVVKGKKLGVTVSVDSAYGTIGYIITTGGGF